MLPLQGKVSKLSGKSFTFSTIIGNEPKEISGIYWRGNALVEGQEYTLIGNLDNDYLFTVEQHNIKDYPSVQVVGTASYIKVNSKDDRNYATFSIAVNQSGKTVYYQCTYNLRTDKLVALFNNTLTEKSLVEVVGSLKLTSYKDKKQLNINVNNFNLLSKGTEKKADEFSTTKKAIPDDF